MSKTLRNLIAATLILGAATTVVERQANAREDIAAIVLSASWPGVGEWYNSGFSGGFPIVECLVGNICPCFHISSIIDAAAGKSDDGMRLNFWASPS